MAGFDFNILAGGVSNLGGAASALFAASGARGEGDRYDAAAEYARNNIGFTKQSELLQQYAASRKIEATEGLQRAQIAANGFQQSGTALDLMRDNATQAALTHATLQMQAGIQESGYEAEVSAATAQ